MLDLRELDNVKDSVKFGIQGIQSLLDQIPNLEVSSAETKESIRGFDNKIKFLSDTKEFYVKAVDILYEESIGALKDTLNTALRYIIFDRNYNCNLVLDDKRGTKTLELTLVDLDEGFEVDLKDGAGQGIRTIISFILKAYYLINKGSRLLFLDEKYSALSEHYIPRFFEFMKRMAEERGIIVVLITHDTRFMDYADNSFTVNDGYVTMLDKVDIDEK